jgi:hypothetical protein
MKVEAIISKGVLPDKFWNVVIMVILQPEIKNQTMSKSKQ